MPSRTVPYALPSTVYQYKIYSHRWYQSTQANPGPTCALLTPVCLTHPVSTALVFFSTQSLLIDPRKCLAT